MECDWDATNDKSFGNSLDFLVIKGLFNKSQGSELSLEHLEQEKGKKNFAGIIT